MLDENEKTCNQEFVLTAAGVVAEDLCQKQPSSVGGGKVGTCETWRGMLLKHFERMRSASDPPAAELLRFWENFVNIEEMEQRRGEQRRATNVSDSDRLRLCLPNQPFEFVRRHYAALHPCGRGG